MTWGLGGGRALKCDLTFSSLYLSYYPSKEDMGKIGWGEVRATSQFQLSSGWYPEWTQLHYLEPEHQIL